MCATLPNDNIGEGTGSDSGLRTGGCGGGGGRRGIDVDGRSLVSSTCAVLCVKEPTVVLATGSNDR